MIRSLCRLIAGLVFTVITIATLAFVAAAGLCLMGTLFITWPVMKRESRTKSIATIDLVIAGLSAVREFTDRS